MTQTSEPQAVGRGFPVEYNILSVFAAGVATLVTPCILPMIPIYLSLLMGASLDSAKSANDRFRLLLAAVLFVAGFSAVFTLLGLGASSLGSVLSAHRTTLLVVGGGLIVLFGLKYLGVFKVLTLDRTFQLKKLETGSRALDAFLFGIVFALGWTPCVGPILGSVLTYTAATTTSAAGGALYLFAYSLGVGIPLIVVAALADRLVPHLRKLNRHLPRFEKATGVVMVVVGLVLVVPAAWQELQGGVGDSHRMAYTGDGAQIQPLGEATERPRLVEFYTEGCPVCEKMAPRFAQLSEDCVSERVDIVAIDLSDARNAHLREELGITAVPTVKLFAEDGSVKGQMFGEQSIEDLRAAAAALIEAVCVGEEPRTEFASDTPACSTDARQDTAAAACEGPESTQGGI